MAIIVIPNVFSAGNTIIASQHNSNFATIYNDYNGNITDSNVAAGAAIEYSKLQLVNSIKSTDLLSTTIIGTSNGGTGSSSNANAANGAVVLNSSSQLPVVSGINLTNIGNSSVTGILGAWSLSSFVSETIYQASTDIIIFITGGNVNGTSTYYSDSSSNPTTVRNSIGSGGGNGTWSMTCVCRKGDYWKVLGTGSFSTTIQSVISLGS
jgi:hypothetical protein